MKKLSVKNGFEKLIAKIIMVLGALMVLAGIILLLSGKSHLGPTGSGLSRANTGIEFGADFYTTSAQYTGLAANTATDIYGLIQICFAILFIFIGAVTVCVQLKNYYLLVKDEIPADIQELPVIDEVSVVEHDFSVEESPVDQLESETV